MYYGSWNIDDYLTFSCTTHLPSTGEVYDADSDPSYRVYEDEVGTIITSGTLSKLNDSDTTGFYSERIQLTAALGFEKSKTYTIYVQATVDSVEGITHHNFQILAKTNVAKVLDEDPLDAASVLEQVETALENNNLDHLMKEPVANNADMTVEVADGTVLSNMLSSTSDTSSYAVATDSLEAQASNVGIAGAGLSAIDLPDQIMNITGNITGSLSGSVGSVTDGVTLADDAITSSKYDESTAFPLENADSGSTYIARAPDGSETLDTIASAISGIGSGTSSSLNFAASNDNVLGDLKGIAFVGTQTSGTYDDTSSEDNTYHTITDSGLATDIDIVYFFELGTNRRASQIIFKGYVTNNDTIEVYAYDFSTSSWDTTPRRVITGSVSTSNATYEISLLEKHTGTGTEAGHVYLRFQAVGESAIVLNVDELLADGQVVGSSTGYAEGAVWVKATGTSGTTPDVNGTADNPCPWADALVVAVAKGLTRFHIVNGETVTLSASLTNSSLTGNNWTLDLGGQDITNSYFSGAKVSGTATATSSPAIFEYCGIGAVSMPLCRMYECGIGRASGTFTANGPGQYNLIDCFSLVPGSNTPVFNFAGTGGTTGVNIRRFSGGTNMTLDSNVTGSLELSVGGGQTIVTGGASFEIRGICRAITLTVSGTETVQIACLTGPITVTGSAPGATVNIYGVHGEVTTSGTTATVNVLGLSQTEVNDQVGFALTSYDAATGTNVTDSTTSINNNIDSLNDFDPANDTVDISASSVDAIWDEVLTGATHNVATSAGRRLRLLAGSVIIDGTVVSSTDNTVTLDSDASSTAGAYDPAMISIVEGTGAGQTRLILEYSSSKVAVIDRDWKVNPDATSEYIITGHPGRQHVNEGLLTGATTTSATLNSAASPINNTYRNEIIYLRSGTGQDQARRIISYDGATKIATISHPWEVVPDATSAYIMIPMTCVEMQTLAGTELEDIVGTNFSIFYGNDDAETLAIVDNISDVKEQTDKLDSMIVEDGGGNQLTEASFENMPTVEIDITDLESDVEDIKTQTDKLDSMIEVDSDVGYKFTEEALEEVPSGGLSETELHDALDSYTATSGDIKNIKDKTDTIPTNPAAAGADGDTLETLSDQIDNIASGATNNIENSGTTIVRK